MNNQQKDIFISYCRRDIEKVKRIKQEIEAETLAQCWMDLEGIESGNPKFTKIIVRAINSCPIFLFMLSEASQQSENALKELDFAYDKYHEEGKKVVIVYIEPCKMNDEFKFDYQKADTIDWQNPLQKEKLIRDLKAWTNYEAQLAKFNKEKELLELAKAEAQQKAEEARKKREEEALREAEAERKRKEEQQKKKEQRVALSSSFISLFRQNFMKKSTIWWVSGGMVTILMIVFSLKIENTQDPKLPSKVSSSTENLKKETEIVEEIKSTEKTAEVIDYQIAEKDSNIIISPKSVKEKNDEHPSKKVALSDSSKNSSNVKIAKVTTPQKKDTITLNKDELSEKKNSIRNNITLFLQKYKYTKTTYVPLRALRKYRDTLNYINTISELEKIEAKVRVINAQLESYEQLVSEESEKTAPTFQLR